MAVNPLPPQAFTKETLQKAYTWLLTQSPSIKEMASTQDMLISLYLKAQRNGDASLDTPSIQNFKQELKSLAGIMGDLQTPPAGPAPTTGGSSFNPPPPSGPSTQTNQAYAWASGSDPAGAAAFGHGATTGHYRPQSAFTGSTTHAPNSGTQAMLGQLDAVSLQALADVKLTLNLSSEAEALRALIALGYRQFKKLGPA